MELSFFAVPFALSGTVSLPSLDEMYFCFGFLFLSVKNTRKRSCFSGSVLHLHMAGFTW